MQLLMLSQASLPFSFNGSNNGPSSNCVHHEKLALLQLKSGFLIERGYYNSSSRLDSWNPAIDCCSWEGITCDEGTSHVIGLDLSSCLDVECSWIKGRIDPSLFHLRSLQKLNLSWNYFYPHPIPSGLGHLTNLTHLNLSYSEFTGQIPLEISRLAKLVSLDLSDYFQGPSYNLMLKNPNLTTLVGNLSSLQELFLDRVSISGEHGGKWAQAISNAMPNLQRLSLRDCGLQGPIDLSLFRILDLSQLSLDGNNLSIVVPDFLDNPHLAIGFPKFSQNKALQSLLLGNTTFQKKLLDSINNLKFLKKLSARNCNISGSLPSSIANLIQLEHLGLSSNNFSGTIPSSYGGSNHAKHKWVADSRRLYFVFYCKQWLSGPWPCRLTQHTYFS
ncbi:receptor-like protein 12 isoform X1 [Cinnamomum micranthum f. kanehirae]|uniref:Receptor-like protein 12 isoform X1 n=1 Tax=Cinnamomum micranthum f. kanehirae TaxID=337451 RepID=A0A3S3MYM5_9MAGN|nr:receptor-like protein 12 isoform X1 [Cinnamomum micranthum f. kanehirae]